MTTAESLIAMGITEMTPLSSGYWDWRREGNPEITKLRSAVTNY